MSILGLRCPPEFRQQFIGYLEKQIDVASRAAIDKRRLDALADLVTHVRSLPESNADNPGDPRFYALWHCAVNSGQPISDTPFAPGRNVQTVISQLGDYSFELVGSDDAFSEIVVAAFIDTLDHHAGKITAAQLDVAQALNERDRFATIEPDLTEARERLAQALADNGRLSGELRGLEEVVRFLKAGNDAADKPKASKKVAA